MWKKKKKKKKNWRKFRFFCFCAPDFMHNNKLSARITAKWPIQWLLRLASFKKLKRHRNISSNFPEKISANFLRSLWLSSPQNCWWNASWKIRVQWSEQQSIWNMKLWLSMPAWPTTNQWQLLFIYLPQPSQWVHSWSHTLLRLHYTDLDIEAQYKVIFQWFVIVL